MLKSTAILIVLISVVGVYSTSDGHITHHVKQEQQKINLELNTNTIDHIPIILKTQPSQPKPENKDYEYLWVTATGYCPCAKCCGRCSPGITKTGRSAWKEGVAVDPKVIPLGSHIDIPGYTRGNNGSWILADDIGGKIKGHRIDIRFETHDEAKQWGVRKILIRVWR